MNCGFTENFSYCINLQSLPDLSQTSNSSFGIEAEEGDPKITAPLPPQNNNNNNNNSPSATLLLRRASNRWVKLIYWAHGDTEKLRNMLEMNE